MEIVSHTYRVLKPNAIALFTYNHRYLENKFGAVHRALKKHIRTLFSIKRGGVALSPRASRTIYGEREMELRKKRGFGISQKYLVLRPRATVR